MATKSIAVGFLLCALTVSTASAGDWGRTTVETKRLAVGAGGMLDVDVDDADIVVSGGSANGVEIEVEVRSSDVDWARETFKKLAFKADSDGEVVRVRSRRPRSDGMLDYRRGFGMTIRIKTPERFDIDARTKDGDIAIERANGTVTALSADGDIRIAKVSGRSASARTSDGDIVLKNARVASIVLETADGDIRTKGITADSTKLKTSDGDITIRVGEGAGLKVKLRGEEVQMRGAVAFEGKNRTGHVEGTVNGGGGLLEATTSDGDVRLSFDGR